VEENLGPVHQRGSQERKRWGSAGQDHTKPRSSWRLWSELITTVRGRGHGAAQHETR
jgi:hypothetical protein